MRWTVAGDDLALEAQLSIGEVTFLSRGAVIHLREFKVGEAVLKTHPPDFRL